MENLNVNTFKLMLQNGTNNLNNNKEHINALNVFPVPDGDTGTNMSLTFSNGNKAAQLDNKQSIYELSKGLSKGLLMGARGNSGVILSQIFRGFSQGLEGVDEATTLDLANAFLRGSEVAYKAVMKPVEGTILTVIRLGANNAHAYTLEHPELSIVEYFEKLVEESNIALEGTPELLPVLKEVGVVDSGGAGLVLILEGFLKALKGETIDVQDEDVNIDQAHISGGEDEYGYCTEFILRLGSDGNITFNEATMKQALGKLGNSIVLVQDEDLVKVHVHTLTPGVVLNMAQQYGEFVTLKIENMQEQHDTIYTHNHDDAPVEKKKYALITVTAGEGLKSYFETLHIDKVISGGQTMNPSTEDFLEAIKDLNAEHIIILPNNSNIILAAEQVKSILEDQSISVVPSKSVVQGISAAINFNPEDTLENNLENMNAVLEYVKTGEVTYAIKDTQFEGLEIHEGDFMGIANGKIVSSETDLLNVTKALIKSLVTEDDELITLIVGEDSKAEDQAELEAYIEENYDCELEVIDSKQPIYYYVIGVE
ncbi:MAG: DAK2 domain-containing protein [Erysipelothrix sp.]|nr:DAK2 domain-containing protein [Erysipelothrix sp.]